MNSIKAIEHALQVINQARFQDLINHLLHVQGNHFISAPGSVTAKEKTSKGTPDSFFINNGKYIFVECTTQEKLKTGNSFQQKLQNDITHCFNETKTGISNIDIQEIILAFTAKISPEEYANLAKLVSHHNIHTKLTILDIQNLPMHIHDFPGLSEQYLGITIVKGEIYNLPDYLQKTTKGLQPSLINEFVGRTEEITTSLGELHHKDILLLSGSAGVGKSKLGVTLLTELSKEGFLPIVIQSSAVPLWDDFVNLFHNGRNYSILFDDANKSVQNLSYLLDFIERPKSNRLKLIITTRDYVKSKVVEQLTNTRYSEIVVEKFKDDEISSIIRKALPQLNYHHDIQKKITDLAKGNARVALMATYSVTPDAETNYLNDPVLLYEKYFRKIALEIEAFSKPITLKALAIVAFFGVLDRRNETIRATLEAQLNINWNELWTSILELHAHEILDVYTNETAKVSDQVLATFAFYKCFIDRNTAVINYGDWIFLFIEKFARRIKETLIDVNNTFHYHHIKDIALPHLQKVITQVKDNDILYTFHTVFWFYKSYDTLIYLRNWVDSLPATDQEPHLKFAYKHNDHISPTRYFELLIEFWKHPTELLKPALALCVELVAKQPDRLAESLKFLNEGFSYTLDDIQNGYDRQQLLVDTLLAENRSSLHAKIAHGCLLNLTEKFLGWHFTEYGPSKGHAFTITNFHLCNSSELLNLRRKLLENFYNSFQEDETQSEKIMNKLVHPEGEIDKEIYVAELPIYEMLIADKLTVQHYHHCMFVKELTEKLTSIGQKVPTTWNNFIHSEIMTISETLLIEPKFDADKTWEQEQMEKRATIEKVISDKTWPEIESLLLIINTLYQQQPEHNRWYIDTTISEIFMAIANNKKENLSTALLMIFNGTLSFPVQPGIANFIIHNNILSGKELNAAMSGYCFNQKTDWLICLLEALPEEQVDLSFLELLIQTFSNASGPLTVFRITIYGKYEKIFQEYKAKHSEQKLEQHNIITYLTELLLKGNHHHNVFEHGFCQKCAPFFSNHLPLLKRVFIYLKNRHPHYDYDGKELETLLQQDNNFFIEYLEQKTVGSDYLTFRFERFNPEPLWRLTRYKELINKSLAIILSKKPIYSNSKHVSANLFPVNHADESLRVRIEDFITEFIKEHNRNEEQIKMIMNIVLHNFPQKFIPYLQQLLLLNTNFGLFHCIHLEKATSYSGSLVPHLQRKIDFHREIIAMIKTLPNVLDYHMHLNYLEQYIGSIKIRITEEQRKDFEEIE